MATPSPAQQIADEIRNLQSKVGDLQGRVQLTRARDAVDDLQTTVSGLIQKIATFRTRGYVFEMDMENQAQALSKSWVLLYPNLESQINMQSSVLENSLRPLEMQMPQLNAAASNPAAARGLLSSMQSALNILDGKVSAAEQSIEGMYNQFNNEVYQFSKHLNEIEYLLRNWQKQPSNCCPPKEGSRLLRQSGVRLVKNRKGIQKVFCT